MQLSLRSNVGRQRKSNQDYADFFQNNANQALIVLCDGVGGHQAGDVASQLTTQFLGEAFMALPKALTKDTAGLWLDEQIKAVNTFVFEKSITQLEWEGMGTTLVVALIVEESAFIAHVGDSRAYIFEDNQLIQYTQDHSLVNELIKTGEISEQEAATHPQRNVVTQSIGVTSDVEYSLSVRSLDQIDRLMLCSDGLTNMVSRERIAEYFNDFSDLSELTEQLVVAANEAGGRDNITVVIADELEQSETITQVDEVLAPDDTEEQEGDIQ